MPVEPLRNRVRAWLQERLPLAEVDKLLTTKTVPLNSHYLWYYLGGLLLVLLALQMVTGGLLVVHYEASIAMDGELPGAYRSVQTIVNDLPHGWWIRSLHHWGAHVMIMATVIHMFSVLFLKAYRRPRELLWWTGLAMLGLTLTMGFTGYLLPWNSLSFAATRVGGGIAGATPLAGPLIRKLLLAGPDISGATLTRFFGLHVAVLPMLLISLVAAHVGLMAYHGSSVPPSIERVSGKARRAALRFWPEFALRDMRVWILAVTGLWVVATLFPPSLGEPADPMVPTPDDISPEWFFLAMFKVLKMLPSRLAGIENLQLGVLGFAAAGLVLAAMPLLHVSEDPRAKYRRWQWVQRWCLLLAGAGVGWAATMLAFQPVVGDHWPGWWGVSAETAMRATPIVLAGVWVLMAVITDLRATRYPHGGATFFSVVLVSALIGYTLWEAFDAVQAGRGLLALWAAMLVVTWTKRPASGQAVSRPAVLVSGLLFLALLLVTIPLGRIQEHMPADVETETQDVVAEAVVPAEPVPSERRSETTGRLIVLFAASAYLLVVVQRQIRYQRRLREMGLME